MSKQKERGQMVRRESCWGNLLRLPSIVIGLFLVVTLGETGMAAPDSTWANKSTAAPARWTASAPTRTANPPGITLGRDPEIVPFSAGSHNVSINVGQVFLMGDLGDQFKDSLGFRVHYTYGVSEIFSFDSNFGYSSHSDSRFSMLTLLAGLRVNLAWYDQVIPHAVFGLGFYKPDYQITDQSSISPVLFGLHLGPGVDLRLSDRLFFGTSLVIHNIFNSVEQEKVGNKTVEMEVGGTYTSFLLHAGVTF